jgi:hypothetical protein
MFDHEIWRVPAFLPYVQPELTETIIEEAEEKLRVKLPNAYLDLMRIQNGGMVRCCLPESCHERIGGIGPRWPSILTSEVSEEWGEVSYDINGLISFDGDGHWHLCLDYREGRTDPCVTYVDIECDSQHKVADSFEAFLKLLQPVPPDYQFVLLGLQDIKPLKKAIEVAVGAKFDPRRGGNHGYKRHIVAKTEGETNNSIWMSANTCRSGFVPREDYYYKEVKDMFPEDAVRFPDFPAGAFFASTTSDWRQKLLDCFEQLEIRFETLEG